MGYSKKAEDTQRTQLLWGDCMERLQEIPDGSIDMLLIPARTDTTYFHDFIMNRAEIRFIKGRLKFGTGKSPAPFPSMLVIFRGPKM
ncbi:hypothetical protein D3Z48_05870 [Clostridiaceae bacterium]|nr:hypothetical protein [Clostridiaceae bacterium]